MIKRLLYIDACVHGEESRTGALCNDFIRRVKENNSGIQTTELNLYQCNLKPLNAQSLKKREECVSLRNFDNPIFTFAKMFAMADIIVIGAPYWDYSFPSVLKIFIENITVSGITYYYDEDGQSHGLCNGKELVYITTSGGYIDKDCNCGYDYMCAVNKLYKIKNTRFISCQGLDLWNSNKEQLLAQAKTQVINCADDIVKPVE